MTDLVIFLLGLIWAAGSIPRGVPGAHPHPSGLRECARLWDVGPAGVSQRRRKDRRTDV